MLRRNSGGQSPGVVATPLHARVLVTALLLVATALATGVTAPEPAAAAGTRFVQVGLGNGYGVALSRSGKLYSWGVLRGPALCGSTVPKPGTTCHRAPSAPKNPFCVTGKAPRTKIRWTAVGPMWSTKISSPRRMATARRLRFRSVDAADDYGLAVTRNGKVYAWGLANLLGIGSHKSNKLVRCPTRVSLPSDVRVASVSAAEGAALALTTDGRVFEWGDSVAGRSVVTPRLVPAPPGVTWRSVKAGLDVLHARGSDGHMYVWGGSSASADLGPTEYGAAIGTDKRYPTPQRMYPADTDFTSTGSSYIGIATDGSLVTWGRNDAGQIGNGTIATSGCSQCLASYDAEPTTVTLPAQGRAVEVENLPYSRWALTSTGLMYGWGYEVYGTGTSTRSPKTRPVRVAMPAGARITDFDGSSSTPAQTILVVTSDGRIYGWGARVPGTKGQHNRPVRIA